jgi:large subunit ribosomal protein L22
MIVTATQHQITVTPRKMRMLAAAISGLKPQEAIDQLNYLNYSAATPLRKTIKQAVANATNNHKLSPDSLVIKEIVVNQGWTFKRFRAAARGRGKPYTKRRSHLTVKLESITPKAIPALKKTAKSETKKVFKKVSPKRPAIKTTKKTTKKITKKEKKTK